MFEHKFLDTATDDLEQFSNQLFSLRQRYMRFPTEAFPYLLRSSNGIGIGFGGFTFLGGDFLFRVGFPG